jgi:hypothetical protein
MRRARAAVSKALQNKQGRHKACGMLAQDGSIRYDVSHVWMVCMTCMP